MSTDKLEMAINTEQTFNYGTLEQKTLKAPHQSFWNKHILCESALSDAEQQQFNAIKNILSNSALFRASAAINSKSFEDAFARSLALRTDINFCGLNNSQKSNLETIFSRIDKSRHCIKMIQHLMSGAITMAVILPTSTNTYSPIMASNLSDTAKGSLVATIVLVGGIALICLLQYAALKWNQKQFTEEVIKELNSNSQLSQFPQRPDRENLNPEIQNTTTPPEPSRK